jgi:hypothetical protein
MTKIRLEYVHEFVDRHGKARRYFRKPGFKQVPLPGAPGSDEFMTVYQLALAGQSPRVQVGAGRTRPGSVNAAGSLSVMWPLGFSCGCGHERAHHKRPD